MQIVYNSKTDLLYLRLDERKQEVINKRLSDDIVLDLGDGDRIIGIEIMDASRNLNLDKLLPITYQPLPKASEIQADSLFVSQVVQCCKSKLDLATAANRDAIPYQSVPLCVIDAVFSINTGYESVPPLIRRYCKSFTPALKERRINKDAVPEMVDQQSVTHCAEFLQAIAQSGDHHGVFNNQRVHGRLKTELVLEFCQVLREYQINYLQDIHHIATDVQRRGDFEKLETAITNIYGISDLTWKYFLMLCRIDGLIKADRHLRAFVKNCIGRRVNIRETESLLKSAHRTLIQTFPELTLRMLDREIWQYQRRTRKATI